MSIRKYLFVGGAIALATTFAASPSLAQETCVTDDGTTVAASGTATGTLSLACGANSSVNSQGAVAVGNSASTASSFAVAIGYDASGNGVNGIAIGSVSNATTTNSVGIGMGTWANGADSVAIGAGAQNQTYANSVALGAWTQNTAANQVAVGNRTVSGVTAAALSAISTDAVNGAQLFATNSRLDALELMALDFDVDLRELDRKIEGSTALAIAMSGNAFLPDKAFNVTGNVGTYKGAWAAALQIGAIVSPNAAFNAGIATNFNRKGGVGARAGFTIGWGR